MVNKIIADRYDRVALSENRDGIVVPEEGRQQNRRAFGRQRKVERRKAFLQSCYALVYRRRSGDFKALSSLVGHLRTEIARTSTIRKGSGAFLGLWILMVPPEASDGFQI
jgi:hypothetical protein